MDSIDLLRRNLSLFVQLQGEWTEVRLKAKQLVHNSLEGVIGIEYDYSGDELLFNTLNISDENTINVLKLYRQIAISLRYSTDQKFKKLIPKIQLFSKLTNTLQRERKTSDIFMSALQDCRLSRNRVVCRLNDRGYKASFFQIFEYDLNKILRILDTFKEYDSAYKNYCLYTAINKMYNAEFMLLQTLKSICENRYDILRDESECWAGVMCALKIIDYFYLTNTLTEDSTFIIQLSFLLLNIYIKYHSSKDSLRIMECYANRSRLIERLYKSPHFISSIWDYSERLMTNHILIKYLCMYDLEQAKKNTPNEFVGRYAENYNYYASQLMMYQNQGLGIILPDNGDAFDTSINEVISLGKSIADEINNKLESRIQPIFNNFKSNYNKTQVKLKKIVSSYYKTKNARNEIKLTNLYCLSWAYQLESYTFFGIQIPNFIPQKYQLRDFLQNVHIEMDKIKGPNHCNDQKKYFIHEFNKSSTTFYVHNEIPFIKQLTILTDAEDNLKAFRCYGSGFKDWIRELQRHHMFFGIPVRFINAELYKLPETLNLKVCFQEENDINL